MLPNPMEQWFKKAVVAYETHTSAWREYKEAWEKFDEDSNRTNKNTK